MPLSRRTFLTASAATLAASSLASAQTGQTPMPPGQPELDKPPLPPAKKIGIAIVGLGKLAIEEVLPAFAKTSHCRVAALVSGNPQKAQTVAQTYNVAPTALYNYDDFDTIKNNPDVDAVYIILPNALHAEFTIRAAQAGKHILCEKPMATASDDCRKMIDAAKAAQKQLMIAYRIQYEPNNNKARELIQSKAFGQTRLITSVNAQLQKGGTWRTNRKLAGGGALPDIGLYCLNTTRFLLAEEPVEVRASTFSTPGDDRFREVEELVQFNLRFPSNTHLVATASYNASEDRRYRALADKGWVGMDPAFSYTGLKLESQSAASKEKIQYKIEEANQFALEMDHFATSLLDNKPVKTPGEEGLKDQLLMEAIYQSAQSNQPVKLDPSPNTARD
jgi:predicted dehydrogenase